MQDLSGRINSGSFFFALTFLHMFLYAVTGHNNESGIAIKGVSNTLSNFKFEFSERLYSVETNQTVTSRVNLPRFRDYLLLTNRNRAFNLLRFT